MFGIGLPELGLVLVISLVVFGPSKLPEIGKAIGKTLGEFRKATETPAEAHPEPMPMVALPASVAVAEKKN